LIFSAAGSHFGPSPMLSVAFQRKKLTGIAEKCGNFSSTTDRADLEVAFLK
jgi:hypothetical protein